MVIKKRGNPKQKERSPIRIEINIKQAIQRFIKHRIQIVVSPKEEPSLVFGRQFSIGLDKGPARPLHKDTGINISKRATNKLTEKLPKRPRKFSARTPPEQNVASKPIHLPPVVRHLHKIRHPEDLDHELGRPQCQEELHL
jgi:hypothetical protein